VRVTVFCASRVGADPAFVESGRGLGAGLAGRGIGLVYGGASVGVMGALADAALAAGGEVIGVIPESLVAAEVAHDKLSEQRVVDTMHTRKSQMMMLGDHFVALPGGIGTLEEWFEALTWRMLGLHDKPCSLIDIHGYWRPLLAALRSMVDAGLMSEPVYADIQVFPTVDAFLRSLG
jgi:hypothetical protein